jgi:hypothetical protein
MKMTPWCPLVLGLAILALLPVGFIIEKRKLRRAEEARAEEALRHSAPDISKRP